MMRLVTALGKLAFIRGTIRTSRRCVHSQLNDFEDELTLVDSKIDEQRRKSFVNKIKRAGDNIDWNNVLADKRLNKTQSMVRLMAQIIRCRGNLDQHVLRSLREHLHKNPISGANPVYDAHYCILLLVSDQSSDNDVRDRLLKVASDNPKALRFPVFTDLLGHLAERSKENATFVQQMFKDHPNTFKSTGHITTGFLKFGLFNEALQHLSADKSREFINYCASLFFQQAHQHDGQQETKLELLRLLADGRAFAERKDQADVEQTLRSLGYADLSKATIKHDHICQNCATKLRVLSENEFNRLAEAVKSKCIIIKDNKYINTTPEEFDRFTKFVENLERLNIKFDLVVDVMNVMNVKNATRFAPGAPTTQHYRTLGTYRDSNQMKTVLLAVLNQCLKKFDRIMLSGREHLRKWAELNQFLQQHQKQISYFYAANQSADDAFMLHLATLSNSSYIMSNDFFRREQFHLGQDGTLLERLLEYRQIKLTKGLEFINPQNCEIAIHVTDRAIHIPFVAGDDCKWICAKRSE